MQRATVAVTDFGGLDIICFRLRHC
jgi:hypothetical protein